MKLKTEKNTLTSSIEHWIHMALTWMQILNIFKLILVTSRECLHHLWISKMNQLSWPRIITSCSQSFMMLISHRHEIVSYVMKEKSCSVFSSLSIIDIVRIVGFLLESDNTYAAILMLLGNCLWPGNLQIWKMMRNPEED